MNAHRILTGATATLALAGSALAQEPTIVVINDSFDSTAGLGDDQLIRVDDLDGNSSFQDSYETNLLFQYGPSSAGMNYQFVDVEVRDEGGAGVVYFSNNRNPSGFFPQLLRGEDLNLSGRIEPSEVTELVFLETAFTAGGGQGAEGITAHPDGSVWIAADFPGGGLLRWDNGTVDVFVDDNLGGTFATDQGGSLAQIDTDDFTALTWAGTGVISYIDGFGDDRTEAVFRYEDKNGNGATNEDDELTPFLVPTSIHPSWAQNPDFGTVLKGLDIPNGDAGLPGQPPFFVARLDVMDTTLVAGTETYYFATTSSAANFGINSAGNAVNGLVYQAVDLNLDGDCNDAGEVVQFFDGSADPGTAFNLDKILGIAADGSTVYVYHLLNASTPAITVLRDLNGDGDAEDAGELDVAVWDSGILPDVPVWEQFLFGGRIGLAAPGLLEGPLSQFAAISETGCAPFGSLVPRIGGLGDPLLGASSFQVTVENAEPGSPALLMIGDTGAWLGIPIPVDLGVIAGLPGCFLYQNLALTFNGFTDGAGEASFPLGLPNKPQLDGITLPFQVAVIKVQATALQTSLTERMDVTLTQ